MKKKEKTLDIWLIIPIILVGVIVMAIAFYNIKQVPPARDWEQTTGKIIVLGTQGKTAYGFLGGHTAFDAVVRFEYTVDAKKYISSHVPLTLKPYPDEYSAEQVTRDFDLGQLIYVFYDPFDPADAVYVKEDSKSLLSYYGTCMFGAIIIVFGLYELILLSPGVFK